MTVRVSCGDIRKSPSVPCQTKMFFQRGHAPPFASGEARGDGADEGDGEGWQECGGEEKRLLLCFASPCVVKIALADPIG